MMENKLIIFDCDGVLVDSEIISNIIEAKELSKLNYKITTEESIKRFTGMSRLSVKEYIYKETGQLIPDSYFNTTKNMILKEFYSNLEPLMPQVLEFLYQNNIKYCVASSSPRDRVKLSLELTKLDKFFNDEIIFTSELVKKGKPAPDLFLYAANSLQIDPTECIVIEDSNYGIEAAKAANMKALGFIGGGHAQYNWYINRLKKYNVPIFKEEMQIINYIKEEIFALESDLK